MSFAKIQQHCGIVERAMNEEFRDLGSNPCSVTVWI